MARIKPNQPNTWALRHAEPYAQNVASWTSPGVIVDVNTDTYTCDVECEDRGRLTGIAFPYLIQDPEGGGGAVVVPRRGTQVLVQQGIGFPIITQVLPVSVPVDTDQSTTYTVGGETTLPSSIPGMASYRGRMPRGLFPGDWVQMGNQGQHVAMLDGGVALVHAAPWSQMIATQADDTLSIIGRNLKILTGFGELVFSDSGGKQSVSLRGGTDQLTETGAGIENWTVEAQIGGQGTNAFSFKLRDRAGNETYRKTIGFNGSVSETATGSQTPVFKKNIANIYEQSLSTTVAGKYSLTVGSDAVVKYGSLAESVSQNRQVNVYNDRTDFTARDWTASVGRTFLLTVSGNVLAKPRDAAASWVVANGSLVIDVGNPKSGDLGMLGGTAESSVLITAYAPNGNIELTSLLGSVLIDGFTEVALSSKAQVYTDAPRTALGSVTASEPLLKGTTAATALKAYSKALKTGADLAKMLSGGNPGQNKAAINALASAISSAENALKTALDASLSAKVFTE